MFKSKLEFLAIILNIFLIYILARLIKSMRHKKNLPIQKLKEFLLIDIIDLMKLTNISIAFQSQIKIFKLKVLENHTKVGI
jgi:hypothetical protein